MNNVNFYCFSKI